MRDATACACWTSGVLGASGSAGGHGGPRGPGGAGWTYRRRASIHGVSTALSSVGTRIGNVAGILTVRGRHPLFYGRVEHEAYSVYRAGAFGVIPHCIPEELLRRDAKRRGEASVYLPSSPKDGHLSPSGLYSLYLAVTLLGVGYFCGQQRLMVDRAYLPPQ